MMAKFWRVLRQAWWLVVGLGAAVLGLLAVLVFWRPKSQEDPFDGFSPPPPKPLRERAREEVERVRLEGELEKAQKRAYTQVHRAELIRIKRQSDSDPVRARRELAAWLQRNL